MSNKIDCPDCCGNGKNPFDPEELCNLCKGTGGIVMKIKTSELTGTALDWAVAEAEYRAMYAKGEYVKLWVREAHMTGKRTNPYSTDWVWGGPIIEREKISIERGNDLFFPKGNEKGDYYEPLWMASYKLQHKFHGPTPLIAAMRCYCSAKLGDEVDVPEELL